MKLLKITLEGKTYEVGVEVVDGKSAPSAAPVAAAPAAAVAAPVAAPAPAPVAAPVAAGAGSVVSPMPGTVVRVNVSAGQQVAKDQELVVLEAMKMESPIAAPSAGTVKSVLVKQGDSVNEGQVLIELG